MTTDRRGAVADYKKMYDRASALANIGIWECELASEALTWTDGVYDLFELPRGSHVDRDQILRFYEPESRDEMERLRADAIRTCGSFRIDIQIRTARGNSRWIRLTADVEQENGRAVRLFGTKQDISREKAAQEKVRSLQTELIHVSRKSAMGTMAQTLAHELNQPLTAITNYVSGTRRMLNDSGGIDADIATGLDAIEKSAFRAGDIIRSLRAMTEGSADRRQRIDPNPLIREVGAMTVGADKHVQLTYSLVDGLILFADPVQLQQVLLNLIRNAVEAVADSARREVSVSSRRVGDQAEIRVEDSGQGIAPDMLERLFQSFVSNKPRGTGVGLSISRTIIEAHEGNIGGVNRAGGGATFWFTLPLAGSGHGGKASTGF